jgi:uncharacterized protein YukE
VSRPGDLQGLPWPEGDPDGLRSAVSRLRGLAGSFDGARQQVGGASAAGWSGLGEASYSSGLTRASAAVSQLAGSLDTAAGALADLADRIEQAQRQVRDAAEKLRDARRDASLAEGRAETARREAISARATANLSPGAALSFADPLAQAADATEWRAATAESQARDARAEADRVERWAHRQAKEALDSVRAADRGAAGALEGTNLVPGGLGVGGPAAAAGGGAVWNFVYEWGLKPFNPYDSSMNANESKVKWGEYGSGVLFGASEWSSRYFSQTWMRTEPGYWQRAPRWVEPYTRSTPSGGITRVSGYMRRGVWAPSQTVADTATRAKWAGRATTLGRLGAAAALVTAGAGQYFADADNPNLDGAERTGRVVTQTATVGTASAVGGWGGAAGGAAIGTMICPGVGTVVGGVIGGIAGGGLAGGVVDHFNDSIVEWGGNAADDVADWGGDRIAEIDHGLDQAGDAIDSGLDKAGEVLDDLTPDVDLTPW